MPSTPKKSPTKSSQFKTSSSKSPSTLALAHTLHSCKSSRISKTEKELHETCARAFKAAVKGPKSPKELKVTVPLEDLSSLLIEHWKTVEAKEEREEELDLTIWEGRFADYIAFTLYKIKSTDTWSAVDGLGNLSWVEVKALIDLPADDPQRQQVIDALRAASKKVGISYTSAQIVIQVYAERCGGPRHHGGGEILLKSGKLNDLAEKILDDRSSLPTVTPKSRQHAVSAVKECIRVYQTTFIKEIKNDGSNTLTVEGNNALTKASNRQIHSWFF